jgi:uncharacterized BrkB/YihY/UPF0761 family membrane protein
VPEVHGGERVKRMFEKGFLIGALAAFMLLLYTTQSPNVPELRSFALGMLTIWVVIVLLYIGFSVLYSSLKNRFQRLKFYKF